MVLVFRFLRVSAGPTCLALPVNAKDSSSSVSDGNDFFEDSSVVRFRRNLLFMEVLIFRSRTTLTFFFRF